MNTFILYDDALPNADGSRVLLQGLRLDRFQKNPVMLYMHNRAEPHTQKPDGSEVIGRWENIRIDRSRLLANAVFDEKDPLAKKISRKVKEGFLKGASIGIDVHSISDSKKEKLPEQIGSTITKSTLLEASIVDIPQNEDALNHCALYQSFALNSPSKKEQPTEYFLKTIRKYLNLSEDTKEEGLLKAIEHLVDEYKALRAWRHNFLKQQSHEKISEALREGLIQEEEKEKYKAYFYKDFASAEGRLQKLRDHSRLSKKKSTEVAQFMSSIQANVPPSATEKAPFLARGSSAYYQMLKHEPSRLKAMQQQDPAAFRELLEAHLACKRKTLT